MKENKLFFLIIILGAGALGAVGALMIFNIKNSKSFAPVNSINSITTGVKSQPADGYASQISEEASVIVKVVPIKLGTREKENIFDVSFNTHTVNLGYDFAKISILKDNLGNAYPATRWVGGSGGHHLSGELIFPKLADEAKSVQLEIDNVGGVKRTFTWQLK